MLVKERACTGSPLRDVMLEMGVQEARDCRCPSGDSDVRTNMRRVDPKTSAIATYDSYCLQGFGGDI